AVSILRQFVESGGYNLVYIDFGRNQFAFQVDNICQIGVTDPGFVQDDLNQLVSLGLLRFEHGADDTKIYHLTRKVAPFLAGSDPAPPKDARVEGFNIKLHLAAGQSVGKWTLQDSVGQGGNGVVWSAIDSNNIKVAIKFLKPEFFGEQREKRF